MRAHLSGELDRAELVVAELVCNVVLRVGGTVHASAVRRGEPDRLRAESARRGAATADLPCPVHDETETVVRSWADVSR